MKPLGSLALALMIAPAMASAHDGAHPIATGAPGWTSDPEVLLPLLITALLYAVGFARLRARSIEGRAAHARNGACFLAGWAVLAFAVVSPLHEGGERSFTLHMIEHELIMLVAALLLAVSRPLGVMLWALSVWGRQALAGVTRTTWLKPLWRALTNPIVATGLQAVAMIGWHMPALFDRALDYDGWHVAQHLSFLVTALLFWWAMTQRRSHGGYMLSALCLFATSLIGGALGALMTFSSSPWYAGYAAMGMTPFGLSPAEDQQLAGLIMWIPGGMVHAGAALWLLEKGLRRRVSRDATLVL
ncbi:cytochrome c oxidase assembly protein [Rhizorhabdus argentea]|uniref:cytochrome c oxidase assembly protein n=1 Tax=Rhizorhabdus argentea TaxID=1387174 RepID=UPI0030EE98F3